MTYANMLRKIVSLHISDSIFNSKKRKKPAYRNKLREWLVERNSYKSTSYLLHFLWEIQHELEIYINQCKHENKVKDESWLEKCPDCLKSRSLSCKECGSIARSCTCLMGIGSDYHQWDQWRN